MRTPRVFLKTELRPNSIIELDQNISDHLKVTNKKIGQQLQLFDGQGNSTFGNIIEKKKKTFLIKTNKSLNFSKKLKPIFNLGISEIKNFDNVVKQSTPLGINSINCLSSERSKIRKKPSQSKIERWKKIAASSCEQCGMDWVPEIYSNELISWAQNSNDSLKIVLNPRATKSIKNLKKVESLSIAIGPEGGFTDDEIEKLEEEGFIGINCGDMIFRTDTMPIVILSILNFSMRDIS